MFKTNVQVPTYFLVDMKSYKRLEDNDIDAKISEINSVLKDSSKTDENKASEIGNLLNPRDVYYKTAAVRVIAQGNGAENSPLRLAIINNLISCFRAMVECCSDAPGRENYAQILKRDGLGFLHVKQSCAPINEYKKFFI